MTDGPVLPLLLFGWDDAWQRLERRLAGLGDQEYLWEPVRDCWTVRSTDSGWVADWADPDPDPAPVTTIAWRTWHLASDCLADYLSRSPAGRPLAVSERSWHGDAASALRDLTTAAEAFRATVVGMGEQGLRRPLGPAWGPYAEGSWAELVMHALDELAHHGAELALLRDLYRWRGSDA